MYQSSFVQSMYDLFMGAILDDMRIILAMMLTADSPSVLATCRITSSGWDMTLLK